MDDGSGGQNTWKVVGIAAASISSAWLFIASMLHLRTNKANDIANSVREALNEHKAFLGEHYMRRVEVEEDIKGAKEELKEILELSIRPIEEKLDKIFNKLFK